MKPSQKAKSSLDKVDIRIKIKIKAKTEESSGKSKKKMIRYFSIQYENHYYLCSFLLTTRFSCFMRYPFIMNSNIFNFNLFFSFCLLFHQVSHRYQMIFSSSFLEINYSYLTMGLRDLLRRFLKIIEHRNIKPFH